jgi:histidinol-phosphate aminotransferase
MIPGLREAVASLEGYVPGEQPRAGDVIKLNTNENPYPPSPRVLAALRRAADASLRLYPEPMGDTLRSVAAEVYDLPPENILVGNGSDELLSILIRCFVGPGQPVVYPVPTYTLYDTLVAIQEGKIVPVAYPPDFVLPEELLTRQGVLTILCNPNSPSGTLVSLEDVEKLAHRVSGVLIVDEAYVDFADAEAASALPLARSLPHVVVLRSFSKSFSLAGMRVGLAFASTEMISAMAKVKDSYNANRLSLVAAQAALQDLPWMKRNVKRIQAGRRKLASGLTRLGFKVHPSQANFVLARREGEPLRWLYLALKSRGILVRYFDQPGLRDSLRITVGTPPQNAALLRELETVLATGR